MSPKTIILMGRAGSGKGTQSAILKEWLSQTGRPVFYLETGAKFRDFMSKPGYTSGLTKSVVESGGLVPSFLAVWNWGSSLIDYFTGEEHLVIDGTPRMRGEAAMFMEALNFYNRLPVLFIHLNVPAEEVTNRLRLRGRVDDTDEGIKKRLEAFESEVWPVIEYFKTANQVNFIEVNGHQPIESVAEEIKQRLEPYLND